MIWIILLWLRDIKLNQGAQWIRRLAEACQPLNLVPVIYMLEGDNLLSHKLSIDLYTSTTQNVSKIFSD